VIAATGEALVARTRRLDHDVDLLAFAGDDGFVFEKGRAGVAGRGTALTVDWPAGDPSAAAASVTAALAAVAVDDAVGAPGTGAVAFGALPFVPGGPARLVVPEVIAGRAEDGTRWVTTVTPSDRPPPPDPDLTGPRAERRQPQTYTLTGTHSPEWWCDLVRQATKAMADGDFEKVVLARQVDVTTDQPIDRLAVLERLRTGYPGCHIVGIGRFVAASPELLVAVAGDIVRAHPMAGTAPRGGDPAADQRLAASLLASSTYRHEHQVTIDVVHDTLLNWCSYVDYEAEPSVVAVANLQHLATLVEGRLSQPTPSVLDLVAALHPTPAVAGRPRPVAVDWIARHEGIDRGRYAGAAGWVDAAGNGAWAVSVRCAEIEGASARVWAGNGIVADSDPVTELAETRIKFQAMLSALVRP
jgi:isochorismate synthase